MPRKNPTSIVLTKKAQMIKDRLVNIYGLKPIISAGLILLDQYSDKEKNKIIESVNLADRDEKGNAKELSEELTEIKHKIQTLPETTFRILSQEQQQMVDNIRKGLGPDDNEKLKKAKA